MAQAGGNSVRVWVHVEGDSRLAVFKTKLTFWGKTLVWVIQDHVVFLKLSRCLIFSLNAALIGIRMDLHWGPMKLVTFILPELAFS